MLEKLEQTIETVENTLRALSENILQQQYPVKVFDDYTTTEYMLVHLAAHLNYHLGQVNYHRRLIDVDR